MGKKIVKTGKKGVKMFHDSRVNAFLDMTGYELKTTFWDDFFIAERFGEKAIRDTFKRAVAEWKTDKVYMTELVMVLNWKIWMFHDLGDDKLARLYDELWREADGIAQESLKGDDLQYYYRTLD